MQDTYKQHHKPTQNSRYHQGYFIPKHPEKWVTKVNEYRSGWEFKFMSWCDSNPAVKRVGSEPFAIQYRDPVSNFEYCNQHGLDPNNPVNWKIRKYYVDMWVEFLKTDGTTEKVFIEIKPYKESIQPEPLKPGAKLKDVNAYNRAMRIFLTNQAKWRAARYEFGKRGAKFKVFTEKDLEGKLKINL